MSSLAHIMQWEDHKTYVHNHLRILFEEQKFVDVTLFCSTHSVKVHSVVIASNSSYFEKVLLSQNGMNSVIVLKDMKFEVLRALIEFMYCGEATILNEDVDALLYAAKKFQIKGLCRMTRQGAMFSVAEKTDDTAEHDHRFIFPAEAAEPGMIQAVLDLTKNQTETSILENKNFDSLYFKKTAFQRRGRTHKKHGNFRFPDTAMSDTEYAILKEAEESRKALEKLQKYVLNPNGMVDETTKSQTPTSSKLTEPFFLKNSKSSHNSTRNNSKSHSNLKHLLEGEIAAENLCNGLNQQNQNEILESTVLPSDVPIFVDDGNGNYITLDVEMANMIAGQEIKYNLVQGVVMTSDGKGKVSKSHDDTVTLYTKIFKRNFKNGHLTALGSQYSNPASILIMENQFQFESMPVLTSEDHLETNSYIEIESPIRKSKSFEDGNDEISSSTDSGNSVAKRKPFVVKEIIKLKQPKRDSGSLKLQESRKIYSDVDNLVKFDNSGIRGIMF